MLISAFVFRVTARPEPPTITLASKFHPSIEAYTGYFRFNLHRLISGFGTTSSERCLVPSPGDGIKPVIYCSSIRQRERNCFRQLIFWQLRLRSKLPRLRVLTYHLILLSNPVNPDTSCSTEKSAFYVFAWPLVRTTLAIISWTLSSFRPFSNLQR